MKNFILMSATCVVIAFTCITAIAQREIPPQKRALIRELFALSDMDSGAVDGLSPIVAEHHKSLAAMATASVENDRELDEASKVELRTTIKKYLDAHVSSLEMRLQAFVTKDANVSQIIEEAATPVFDQSLTEEDLKALIVFYKSPTGRKLIALQPQLGRVVATGYNQKFEPQLSEFLRKANEEASLYITNAVIEKRKALIKPRKW